MMPITLVTGPANAGKAEVVLDAVRASLARGREPLLVVPTRADAEHYLRELAGGRAAMGVARGALRGADRGDRRAAPGVARAGARRARARAAASRRSRAAAAAAGADAGLRARARRAVRRAAGAARRAGAPRGRARELALRRTAPARSASSSAASTRDYRAALERLGRLDARAAGAAARSTRCASARRCGARRRCCSTASTTSRRCSSTRSRRSAGCVDAPRDGLARLRARPGRLRGPRGRPSRRSRRSPSEHRALPPRADHYAPCSRAALAPPRALAVRAGRRRAPTRRGGARCCEGGGERAELELSPREVAALLDGGMPRRGDRRGRARPGRRGRRSLAEVFAAAGVPFAMPRQRRVRRHARRAAR